MFYYEGLFCPVCNKQFSNNDDVVVCPKCGLPHHRTCWKSVGHCYEVNKHDTEQQWSRERCTPSPATPHEDTQPVNRQVCAHCGAQNPEYAEFCTRCGMSLSPQEWHSAPTEATPPVREYTPSGHPHMYWTPIEKIGENGADELAAVVSKNEKYYLDRFRRITQGRSGGWNWPAFLFGPFWLIYRKQFKLGLLYFFVLLLSNISFAVMYAPVQLAETESAYEAAMLALAESPLLFPVVMLSFVFLALRVILGIKANEFYFRFCENKIADAKIKTPDLTARELTSVGGVSIGLAVLFYALSSMIIEIVTILSI